MTNLEMKMTICRTAQMGPGVSPMGKLAVMQRARVRAVMTNRSDGYSGEGEAYLTA